MLLTFVSSSVCLVSGHWVVLCSTCFLEVRLETESILDHFVVVKRVSNTRTQSSRHSGMCHCVRFQDVETGPAGLANVAKVMRIYSCLIFLVLLEW